MTWVAPRLWVRQTTGGTVSVTTRPGISRNDLGQGFSYDATGQQASAWYLSGGYTLNQFYDGDRLRAKKVENMTPCARATRIELRHHLPSPYTAEISLAMAEVDQHIVIKPQL